MKWPEISSYDIARLQNDEPFVELGNFTNEDLIL